jgi:acetylornithine deacetylase/succinyl-diaminopimelate desuccinylase-like protein
MCTDIAACLAAMAPALLTSRRNMQGLLMGRTDSANLAHLSDGGVLRFLPISLNRTAGDAGLIHGVDERLPVAQYLAAICYYVRAVELMTAS